MKGAVVYNIYCFCRFCSFDGANENVWHILVSVFVSVSCFMCCFSQEFVRSVAAQRSSQKRPIWQHIGEIATMQDFNFL